LKKKKKKKKKTKKKKVKVEGEGEEGEEGVTVHEEQITVFKDPIYKYFKINLKADIIINEIKKTIQFIRYDKSNPIKIKLVITYKDTNRPANEYEYMLNIVSGSMLPDIYHMNITFGADEISFNYISLTPFSTENDFLQDFTTFDTVTESIDTIKLIIPFLKKQDIEGTELEEKELIIFDDTYMRIGFTLGPPTDTLLENKINYYNLEDLKKVVEVVVMPGGGIVDFKWEEEEEENILLFYRIIEFYTDIINIIDTNTDIDIKLIYNMLYLMPNKGNSKVYSPTLFKNNITSISNIIDNKLIDLLRIMPQDYSTDFYTAYIDNIRISSNISNDKDLYKYILKYVSLRFMLYYLYGYLDKILQTNEQIINKSIYEKISKFIVILKGGLNTVFILNTSERIYNNNLLSTYVKDNHMFFIKQYNSEYLINLYKLIYSSNNVKKINFETVTPSEINTQLLLSSLQLKKLYKNKDNYSLLLITNSDQSETIYICFHNTYIFDDIKDTLNDDFTPKYNNNNISPDNLYYAKSTFSSDEVIPSNTIISFNDKTDDVDEINLEFIKNKDLFLNELYIKDHSNDVYKEFLITALADLDETTKRKIYKFIKSYEISHQSQQGGSYKINIPNIFKIQSLLPNLIGGNTFQDYEKQFKTSMKTNGRVDINPVTKVEKDYTLLDALMYDRKFLSNKNILDTEPDISAMIEAGVKNEHFKDYNKIMPIPSDEQFNKHCDEIFSDILTDDNTKYMTQLVSGYSGTGKTFNIQKYIEYIYSETFKKKLGRFDPDKSKFALIEFVGNVSQFDYRDNNNDVSQYLNNNNIKNSSGTFDYNLRSYKLNPKKPIKRYNVTGIKDSMFFNYTQEFEVIQNKIYFNNIDSYNKMDVHLKTIADIKQINIPTALEQRKIGLFQENEVINLLERTTYIEQITVDILSLEPAPTEDDPVMVGKSIVRIYYFYNGFYKYEKIDTIVLIDDHTDAPVNTFDLSSGIPDELDIISIFNMDTVNDRHMLITTDKNKFFIKKINNTELYDLSHEIPKIGNPDLEASESGDSEAHAKLKVAQTEWATKMETEIQAIKSIFDDADLGHLGVLATAAIRAAIDEHVDSIETIIDRVLNVLIQSFGDMDQWDDIMLTWWEAHDAAIDLHITTIIDTTKRLYIEQEKFKSQGSDMTKSELSNIIENEKQYKLEPSIRPTLNNPVSSRTISIYLWKYWFDELGTEGDYKTIILIDSPGNEPPQQMISEIIDPSDKTDDETGDIVKDNSFLKYQYLKDLLFQPIKNIPLHIDDIPKDDRNTILEKTIENNTVESQEMNKILLWRSYCKMGAEENPLFFNEVTDEELNIVDPSTYYPRSHETVYWKDDKLNIHSTKYNEIESVSATIITERATLDAATVHTHLIHTGISRLKNISAAELRNKQLEERVNNESIGSRFFNINEMIYINNKYGMNDEDFKNNYLNKPYISDRLRLQRYINIDKLSKPPLKNMHELICLDTIPALSSRLDFSFDKNKYLDSILKNPLLWVAILITHQIVNDLLNIYHTIIYIDTQDNQRSTNNIVTGIGNVIPSKEFKKFKSELLNMFLGYYGVTYKHNKPIEWSDRTGEIFANSIKKLYDLLLRDDDFEKEILISKYMLLNPTNENLFEEISKKYKDSTNESTDVLYDFALPKYGNDPQKTSNGLTLGVILMIYAKIVGSSFFVFWNNRLYTHEYNTKIFDIESHIFTPFYRIYFHSNRALMEITWTAAKKGAKAGFKPSNDLLDEQHIPVWDGTSYKNLEGHTYDPSKMRGGIAFTLFSSTNDIVPTHAIFRNVRDTEKSSIGTIFRDYRSLSLYDKDHNHDKFTPDEERLFYLNYSIPGLCRLMNIANIYVNNIKYIIEVSKQINTNINNYCEKIIENSIMKYNPDGTIIVNPNGHGYLAYWNSSNKQDIINKIKEGMMNGITEAIWINNNLIKILDFIQLSCIELSQNDPSRVTRKYNNHFDIDDNVVAINEGETFVGLVTNVNEGNPLQITERPIVEEYRFEYANYKQYREQYSFNSIYKLIIEKNIKQDFNSYEYLRNFDKVYNNFNIDTNNEYNLSKSVMSILQLLYTRPPEKGDFVIIDNSKPIKYDISESNLNIIACIRPDIEIMKKEFNNPGYDITQSKGKHIYRFRKEIDSSIKQMQILSGLDTSSSTENTKIYMNYPLKLKVIVYLLFYFDHITTLKLLLESIELGDKIDTIKLHVNESTPLKDLANMLETERDGQDPRLQSLITAMVLDSTQEAAFREVITSNTDNYSTTFLSLSPEDEQDLLLNIFTQFIKMIRAGDVSSNLKIENDHIEVEVDKTISFNIMNPAYRLILVLSYIIVFHNIYHKDQINSDITIFIDSVDNIIIKNKLLYEINKVIFNLVKINYEFNEIKEYINILDIINDEEKFNKLCDTAGFQLNLLLPDDQFTLQLEGGFNPRLVNIN